MTTWPVQQTKQNRYITAKILLTVLVVVGMTSCATSSTGPVMAGPDTFVVSRQAGAFPSGREPLLTEALGEAASACASLGKILNILKDSGFTVPCRPYRKLSFF
jgi:hypothetical protein